MAKISGSPPLRAADVSVDRAPMHGEVQGWGEGVVDLVAPAAQPFVDSAALSAAFAEAFAGPVYASKAAGEAATQVGRVFRIHNGDGTLSPYLRTSLGSRALDPLATSAFLASPSGASGIGSRLELAGATEGDASQLFRETVSLSRFVPKDIFTDLMNGEHTGDIAAHINRALASGENIINPFRLSCIAEPIQLRHDGQSFTGRGTYNTEIRWIANEPTLSMVEVLSGRRDAGTGGASTTNAKFSGAMLSSATGSSVGSAVWVEDGVFHSTISNLRLLNFMGSVKDAYITLYDGASHTSYSVGTILRDITGTAVYTDAEGAPIPRGVWIKSAIEGKFYNVALFGVGDAWVLGDAGAFRTVEDMRWYDCHVEIGNRDGGIPAGTGVRLYGGSNLNFFAIKINAGINDDNNFSKVADQTCVEFMSHRDRHPMSNINFWGSRFWQVTKQKRELIYVNSGAQLDKLMFDSPRVVGVNDTLGFIGTASDFDGDIDARNVNRDGISESAPRADLRGRRSALYNLGRLGPGEVTAFDLSTNSGAAFGVPVAVSCNVNREMLYMSWYKTSATGVEKISVWNPSSDTACDLAEARFAIRHYQAEDIKGSVVLRYDPPAINSKIGINRVIRLPGLQMGDVVAAGFAAVTAGGMAHVIAEAWVSSTNYATIRLFNPYMNKNFSEGWLTLYHLAPNYHGAAWQTYDPAEMATLDTVGLTLAVEGATPGDFVEVSFDKDQQNVIIWGEVTETGFITIRGFNSDAGPIDLPKGEIFVGVRKRHTRV